MNDKTACQLHIRGQLAKDPEVIDGITYATINDNQIDFDNPDPSEIFNGVIHQTIGSCHIVIPQEGTVFIIDNIKLKSDCTNEDIYNIMSKYVSGLNPDSIGLVKVLEPETIEKDSDYKIIRTKFIYGILIDAEPGQIEIDKNPSKHLGLN